MKTYEVRRVLSAVRRGSSLPAIVEREGGCVFTKLHGAAQGPAALVAEIVVARLAEAVGLRVPARLLVWLKAGIESNDQNDELRGLLDRSVGLNLGFELLDGARDLLPHEADRVDNDTAAAILWLDGLVMNPDRSPRNPNLVWGPAAEPSPRFLHQ